MHTKNKIFNRSFCNEYVGDQQNQLKLCLFSFLLDKRKDKRQSFKSFMKKRKKKEEEEGKYCMIAKILALFETKC